MSETTRYPLSWPAGWQRTNGGRGERNAKFRSHGRFISVAAAMDRLEDQLNKLGGRDPLLSTNLRLGMRGDPLSNQPDPGDRGAAVYFTLNGKPRVLACDRYTTVADNIAAIAAHIEALRRIDRYGVGTLDQAFAGYDALPPPGADNQPPWRTVFEFGADAAVTLDDVERRYRELAMRLHPDKGGTHDGMAQLNAAREQALAEVAG